MLEASKFSPVKDAIKKGLEKLNKWYKSLDKSDSYFICLGELAYFFNPLAAFL
jgi:hypothetical protein